MTESSESHANSGVFAFMRGDHVGLRVRDLDAAVAWYRDKLDFRVVRAFEMNGLTFTEMALAGDKMFRLELVSGAGAADRPNTVDLMDSFHLHGWHHLCLRVDDVDKTVAELKRREVRVTLDPHYNPIGRYALPFSPIPGGICSSCSSLQMMTRASARLVDLAGTETARPPHVVEPSVLRGAVSMRMANATAGRPQLLLQ